MVEGATVKVSNYDGSIIDVFDSIVEHLITNKTGVAYMKLNWKRSENDDDEIETQVDIDFYRYGDAIQ